MPLYGAIPYPTANRTKTLPINMGDLQMKDNKLIAEFMGVNIITIDDVRKNKNPYISSADGHLIEDLCFHDSWDWLMPVVKKCRVDSRCEHDEDIFWDAIHWALEECNIENTYKAVVEFINQLNR